MTPNELRKIDTSGRRQRAVSRIEDTLRLSLDQIFTPWALDDDVCHLGIQTLQHLEACANLLKHRPQQDVKRILNEAVNGTSGRRIKGPVKPQRRFFVTLYQKLARELHRSEKRQARKPFVNEELSSDSGSKSESDEDEEDVEKQSVSQVYQSTPPLDDRDSRPEEDEYHYGLDLHSHNDASNLHHNSTAGISYPGHKAPQPKDGDGPFSNRSTASQPDDENPQPLVGNPPQNDRVLNPDENIYTDLNITLENSRDEEAELEILPAALTSQRATILRSSGKRTRSSSLFNSPRLNKRSRYVTQGSGSSRFFNNPLTSHTASSDQSPTLNLDNGPNVGLIDDLRHYGGLDEPDHSLNNNERGQSPRHLDLSRTAGPGPRSSPSHSHLERLLSPRDPNPPTPTSEPPSRREQSTISANDHLNAAYNMLKADHKRELRAYETACTTHANKRRLSKNTSKALRNALETQFFTPALDSVPRTETAEEMGWAQHAARKDDVRCRSRQEEYASARVEELTAFAECIRVRKAVEEKQSSLDGLRRLLAGERSE